MDVQDELHVFFFPFLAPSHIIALQDMARLFAERRGVKVSIVTTPGNAFRFRRTVNESARCGHTIDLLLIPFPSADVGLPDGCESTSSFPPTQSNLHKFYQAVNLLRQPLRQLIRHRRPDCIVSDAAYPWTSDLGIPRIVFESGSPFHACVYKSLVDAALSINNVDSGGDNNNSPFVVGGGGLPHRIEMMRSELPMQLRYPQHLVPFKEAENKCYGVVANCFYELTPEYVDRYCELLGRGRRLWCLGPVWLCNRSDADQAERGGGSSTDSWDMVRMSWLDSQDEGSVLYVCFGSEYTVLGHDQLREIAVGLESSGCPFLWVMKDNEDTRKADWLPQGFEERLKNEGRGVILRGWMPQLQALNHPAVGGFLTHCGWNSTVEAVSSGVPMVAWPLQWEQFINERMIVEVLGVGARVVEGSARTVSMEKEVVKGNAVSAAVSRLMGGGEEAKAMKKRAEEYKEMARSAMEEGGSSLANLSQLIEELTVVAREKKKVNNLTRDGDCK